MADVLFYLSLILIWIMLLYHMFLMQGGFQHYLTYEKCCLNGRKGKELPTVSILIPAHNEEVVIRQTLKAMVQLSYPKHLLEIIVINDNSSDGTGDIVQSFSEQYDHVHMIETKPPFAGKGKSTALNEGLKASTGEVICVYDADNMPEQKAVYHLVLGLLNDPKAGAVVGKFRVINAAKNLLTKFINIETICFQWMAQGGRWKWFGIATIPGTNFAIRRHILEELGGWDVHALAEDTELTIRIYNLGYVIRFSRLRLHGNKSLRHGRSGGGKERAGLEAINMLYSNFKAVYEAETKTNDFRFVLFLLYVFLIFLRCPALKWDLYREPIC